MRNGILVDLSEDFFRYWTYAIPEKETGVFVCSYILGYTA